MQESGTALSSRYDVALLDLDGVVYVGEQAIVGVPPALAAARGAGMRLAFVTNNASRTPQQVVDLLEHVGVPARAEEVVTSSHAAAHYLADRLPAGSPVLVLGTRGLIEAVRERGLRPVFSADEAPAAVVQGFSPDLDWRALAEGMVAIRGGALWLATNLDSTVPSPRGALPGNGALVAALRHATGTEPLATGKPDPTMHAESVERSGAQAPLVVGDRLNTDIEGARRVGCDSLLVLSGVTDPAALLTAVPQQRPDYLGHDVGALLYPHPPVHSADGLVSCGPAVVYLQDGALALTVDPAGDGTHDGLDPLRALCVASWRQLDAHGAPPQLSSADDAGAHALAELGLTAVPPTSEPDAR